MGEMMRALTLAFLFVLTACQDASAPPPPPDYPAPNHQIARRAYMAALQFDGHDNLASETRAERMSAFRYQLEGTKVRGASMLLVAVWSGARTRRTGVWGGSPLYQCRSWCGPGAGERLPHTSKTYE